jgi:hypothetical protein
MFIRFYLLILIVTVCWGSSSIAQHAENLPTQQINVYLINQEVLYERASSQDMQDRRPFNLGFDYQWRQFSLLTELAHFSESTGNMTSSLQRNHRDISSWLRYHFFKSRNFELRSSVFAGMGLGVYEDELKSQLFGDVRWDKSAPQSFTGIVVGAGITAPLQHRFLISILCEMRATSALGNDPNPIWSGIVRMGFGRSF